jgi:hypothetical protein
MFTTWFSVPQKKQTKFKLQYSLTKRKELSAQVITTYNNIKAQESEQARAHVSAPILRCIPLIIENDLNSPSIGDKVRHIVRENYTIGQIKSHVLMRIREKMEANDGNTNEFPSYSGLYFVVGEQGQYIPRNDETIGNMYDRFVDEDGFLYISYMMPNALG